ncbi:MAG: hypothetical protein RIA69_15700 [Cyclobacteriaceae bacterium]
MQRKPNDQFIQAYSEEFSEKVTLDFFDEHDNITGKDILTVSPSKQINFFILKILFKKWQEEMKKLESPYFDYKNNEVRRAMVQFMNTLSQHIVIGEFEFQDLMKEAVEETILLSIAPSDYLHKEFSDKKFDMLSDKHIKPFLKYLRIRREEFTEFFEQLKNASLEDVLASAQENLMNGLIRSEIEAMSSVIPITLDEIFYEEHDDDVIQPIIDEENFSNDLSKPARTEDHYEDHGLTDSDFAIGQDEDKAEQGSGSENYAEEEAVDNFRNDEDEQEPEVEGERYPDYQEKIEEENEVEIESGYREPEVADEAEQDLDADENRSKVNSHLADKKIASLIRQEEKESNENDDLQEINEQPTLNDKFQASEKPTLVEKHTQKKVDSILNAISVNNRYMFTKELFDGDRDAFHRAIAEIEKCTSFDDAVEMIVQSYAKELSWDVNSNEVKELLKVVFRKFR